MELPKVKRTEIPEIPGIAYSIKARKQHSGQNAAVERLIKLPIRTALMILQGTFECHQKLG